MELLSKADCFILLSAHKVLEDISGKVFPSLTEDSEQAFTNGLLYVVSETAKDSLFDLLNYSANFAGDSNARLALDSMSGNVSEEEFSKLVDSE